MDLITVIQQLRERFGTAIGTETLFRDEWTVEIVRERIVEVCHFLKQEAGFDFLCDISGVDNYGESPRFEVNYHLYSFTHHYRLRLKVRLTELDAVVDSVTGVWRGADWHEREQFDFYGILFRHHPNLKRIIMWEGYPYHPLRKDFPLAGLPAPMPDFSEDVKVAETAPMLGGPFVPGTGSPSTADREPRQMDTLVERGETS